MILSVEHRHPTARERFRSLDAGCARVITTCGCEACRLITEERGVQMRWGPAEARRRLKVLLLVQCACLRAGAWETWGLH